MRGKPGETYEEWAKRAQMYEHGVALQRIAEGHDVEKVMEDMSRRLTDKLLHPVLKAVLNKDPEKIKEEVEQSKARYEELYLKNSSPRADHVQD